MLNQSILHSGPMPLGEKPVKQALLFKTANGVGSGAEPKPPSGLTRRHRAKLGLRTADVHPAEVCVEVLSKRRRLSRS